MRSIFRSMRWRLQLWYAGVLLLVISLSGILVYWQARAARLGEIDTKLKAASQYLDAVLRSLPPPELAGESPFPDEPPPRRRPEEGERRPPPPFGPGPPRSRADKLAELEIRSTFGREEKPPQDQPFFLIWRADESLLRRSDATLNQDQSAWAIPEHTRGETVLDQHGPVRLAYLRGPGHTTLVVGKPAAREFNELRTLAWQLSLGGLAALGLGLVGGWWVSARVLKPISAISSTAAAISAANLSERIETADIDRELVDLAEVLNATFARLQTQFERQVRFTADASHELRTPLAVVFSNVELALSRPRTVEEYQETLKRCKLAAARMRGLVDGLLTLARVDAGRLDLDLQPIDLRPLIEETVDHFQLQAERGGIELAGEIVDDTVTAAVDPLLVSRVLENLTANALRHTPAGGRVTLIARMSGARPRLEVNDTGAGIALEDQPRIFERFFRADKARSRASGGNGLGLAICKSLVESLHGTISFHSVVGTGTTFVVEFGEVKMGDNAG
jgi:two-component system OmpR family sensor kinase